MTIRKQIFILIGLTFSISSYSQDSGLIDIMTNEMSREFEVLGKEDPTAYYMDYSVYHTRSASFAANLGSLTNSLINNQRNALVNVRVGDYDKDHTQKDGDGHYGFGSSRGSSEYLPIDNNEKAIQFAFWRLTKAGYQSAEKIYKNLDFENDTIEIADFSIENSEIYLEDDNNIVAQVDTQYWEALVTNVSNAFSANEDILDAIVSVSLSGDRQYFCSTEGSKIIQNKNAAFVSISATIRANDKTSIPLYKTYFAYKPEGLPSEQELLIEANSILLKLDELKSAPITEPYSGPAILHPRASGVFFHEIFGHRIEGHRLKSETDGQTFKEKIDEQILPEMLSVDLDPTLREIDGQDLIGSYSYDDEGVKAGKVSVVENGKLKTFLMSRSPLDEIEHSNGHGRAQLGMPVVSRQSNMIVKSNNTIPLDELRERLILECSKQGLEYGYYFVDVTGGFTQTSRYQPNAFNITPTLVYRIYVDKREDELVRGVDLIGTPLAMFAEISACSDEMETFNGFCGAESGSVPVSATAPGLLVRRIETQKKIKGSEIKLPLLTNPAIQQKHD